MTKLCIKILDIKQIFFYENHVVILTLLFKTRDREKSPKSYENKHFQNFISFHTKNGFEKKNSVDEHITMIDGFSQRMVVLIIIHINLFAKPFQISVVFNSLAWWHSKIILSNHQINRGFD